MNHAASTQSPGLPCCDAAIFCWTSSGSSVFILASLALASSIAACPRVCACRRRRPRPRPRHATAHVDAVSGRKGVGAGGGDDGELNEVLGGVGGEKVGEERLGEAGRDEQVRRRHEEEAPDADQATQMMVLAKKRSSASHAKPSTIGTTMPYTMISCCASSSE